MFPNCDIELWFNSPYLFPTEILRYDAVTLTEILSYTLSLAIQWDINAVTLTEILSYILNPTIQWDMFPIWVLEL